MAQQLMRVDGRKVATLRNTRQLTLKELAAKALLGVRTVESAERGGAFRLSTVTALAKVFSVKVEELAEEPSAAVLEFDDAGAGAPEETLGKTCAAQIRSDLLRIGGFRVSEESIPILDKRPSRIRRVAKRLDISNVITVSPPHAGGSGAITVELWDLNGILSGSYKTESGAPTLHDSDVQALLGKLRPRPAVRSERERAASRAYEEGCFYFDKLRPETLEKAQQCFEEAIALDPGHTRAYVRLASCLVATAVLAVKPAREVMPRAREAALKAAKLDERDPEVHAVLGAIVGPFDYDWRQARDSCKRALASDQVSPWACFVSAYLVLIPLRHFGEAINVLRTVVEEKPLEFLARLALASAYGAAGSHELAVDELNQLLKLHDGAYWPALWGLGLSYWDRKMTSQATKAWDRCLECTSYPPVIGCLASVSQMDGNSARADRLLAQLGSQPDVLAAAGYGWFHVLHSDFEAAAHDFGVAVEARDPSAVWIASEPVLEAFRASPHGRELMRKMRLPADATNSASATL